MRTTPSSWRNQSRHGPLLRGRSGVGGIAVDRPFSTVQQEAATAFDGHGAIRYGDAASRRAKPVARRARRSTAARTASGVPTTRTRLRARVTAV